MIFQEDITQLESDLLQLQQRINQLHEAEIKAENTTAALKDLIDAIAPLGKLQDLKTEVLALFGDDGNDGNDENDTPISPLPTPTDGTEVEPEEFSENDAPIESIAKTDETEERTSEIQQKHQTSVVNEETTPKREVLNRLVKGEYIELIVVSDAVAYFHKDEQILATYIGSSNKQRLHSWGQFLTIQHTFGCSYEIRPAKRMAEFGFKHELKLLGMIPDGINWLAQQDFKKNPPQKGVEIEANTALLHERADVKPDIISETESLDLTVQQATEYFIKADEKPVEAESINAAIPMTQNQAVQEQTEDEPTYLTGDEVEIISDRHGVEFKEAIGKITTVGKVGAVIDIDGTVKWFGFDEIQPIKNTIQPPLPKQPASPYTFVLASATDNVYTVYQVYEGNRFIGKVEKLPVSEKWTYKHGGYYPTKEAAAAAMDNEQKRDERGRKALSQKLINQYAC